MKIGDRIKTYEKACSPTLLRRMPVFIRIDGRAFHTFTRGCKKPFDYELMEAMVRAGEETAKDMGGCFKVGYHQSDEFTFMLLDTDNLETEPWFDNDLSKLVSITASLFTAHFNKVYINPQNIATFDARAFNVPYDDFPNVFIWRQRDWERNSLQMFSRSFYSQKELHGKKRDEMHEMLFKKNQNWANLPEIAKNGTFITPDRGRICSKLNYEEIKYLLESQKKNEEL